MKNHEFLTNFGGTPLAIGSICGVRTWNVDRLGRLVGKHQYIWRPGENVAVCNPDEVEYFLTRYNLVALPFACKGAEPNCVCGFYAYYDLPNPIQVGEGSHPVRGVIQGYGRTTIGREGFRCMKAKILAVTPTRFVDAKIAARLRHNYPDVKFFDDVDSMLADFPPYEPDYPTPETDPDFWTRKAP
jgi:hypothetical protein